MIDVHSSDHKLHGNIRASWHGKTLRYKLHGNIRA